MMGDECKRYFILLRSILKLQQKYEETKDENDIEWIELLFENERNPFNALVTIDLHRTNFFRYYILLIRPFFRVQFIRFHILNQIFFFSFHNGFDYLEDIQIINPESFDLLIGKHIHILTNIV